MEENLGRRIADLRAKLGWTQQELADRVAISRVAVSHLESGLSDPGERTVVLLAGLFHVEPRELVAGTKYPIAKAERLPPVAARYTEVEHQVELFENDMLWLARTRGEHGRMVREMWEDRLHELDAVTVDEHGRSAIAEALRRLRVITPEAGKAVEPDG